MNIHAPPKEIRDKYPCLEWRGKPFRYKNRIVYKAFHKTLETTLYYSPVEDFSWFPETIPDWFLVKIN